MASLFQILGEIYPLSEAFRGCLEESLKAKDLSKKGYLLKSGSVCRTIYFVEKGLLRSYYKKNDREISCAFYKENDFCVSLGSFFRQTLSGETFQAIEDCSLFGIGYDDFMHMSKSFHEFNIIAWVLLERCLALKDGRLSAMWIQSARDRYDWLNQHMPDLGQRVHAKLIASFLGITPGRLSTIRNPQYK
jgi:CRP/FNR family transcriptional regulator, anaerobic regulatory protein